MTARAVYSGSISCQLINIPVKFYTAASSEQIRFNLLTKDGKRVKMRYEDTDGIPVERSDLLKGYEIEKNNFVTFTEDELKALESDRNNSIKIQEFISIQDIDLVQIDKSYYLKPDKGGDNVYQLLAKALNMSEKAAVGTWSARGKEHLTVIRSYKGGLLLHTLYFKNEVRDFENNAQKAEFSDDEIYMAKRLIDALTNEQFDASVYRDSFSERVLNAANKKLAGKEVTGISSDDSCGRFQDLMSALKKSLEGVSDDPEPKPPSTPKRKTRSKKTTTKKNN